MNTMSTKIRKYELKAGAESQRETRDRIAKVAAELHEEKGVANTTVAEIARRAEVTRLTVHNHFADLASSSPPAPPTTNSCTRRPTSTASSPRATPTSARAASSACSTRWYRETEPMYGKLFSDRASVPELDPFLEQNIDRMLDGLATTRGSVRRPQAESRAAARTNSARARFWTWRRLARDGLDAAAAADLMAAAVATGVT